MSKRNEGAIKKGDTVSYQPRLALANGADHYYWDFFDGPMSDDVILAPSLQEVLDKNARLVWQFDETQRGNISLIVTSATGGTLSHRILDTSVSEATAIANLESPVDSRVLAFEMKFI